MNETTQLMVTAHLSCARFSIFVSIFFFPIRFVVLSFALCLFRVISEWKKRQNNVLFIRWLGFNKRATVETNGWSLREIHGQSGGILANLNRSWLWWEANGLGLRWSHTFSKSKWFFFAWYVLVSVRVSLLFDADKFRDTTGELINFQLRQSLIKLLLITSIKRQTRASVGSNISSFFGIYDLP